MSYLSCSSCVLFVPFSFSTLVFFISFLTFIFHLLSLFIYLFLFGFKKKNIVLVFFFFFTYLLWWISFRYCLCYLFLFFIIIFLSLCLFCWRVVVKWHTLIIGFMRSQSGESSCFKRVRVQFWLHTSKLDVITNKKKHKQTKKMLHSFSWLTFALLAHLLARNSQPSSHFWDRNSISSFYCLSMLPAGR